MSYHYFRSHHGTPSSTRLRMIAHLSEQHRAFVTAIYWEIYDYASRNSPRGSLNGIDYDEIAFSQEIECHAVSRIVTVMRDKGFITPENTFEIWNKEQPIREDDGAAERQAKKRARDKEAKKQEDRNNSSEKESGDPCDNSVTSHNVTQRHDIQDNKTNNKTNNVVYNNITPSSECSELSTIDDLETEPPDEIWDNINFNDLIVCSDLVCGLLGQTKLSPADRSALQSWHRDYDMRLLIYAIRDEMVIRVRERKKTNSLRFFSYLTHKIPRRDTG